MRVGESIMNKIWLSFRFIKFLIINLFKSFGSVYVCVNISWFYNEDIGFIEILINLFTSFVLVDVCVYVWWFYV